MYYGGVPYTGLWRLSIPDIQDYLARELAPATFGESIDEFRFGCEIAELEGWGKWFTATRGLVKYSPKSRSLLSVGQIEWTAVKERPAEAQFDYFVRALTDAIEQIPRATRKPRSFDAMALSESVQQLLTQHGPSAFIAK